MNKKLLMRIMLVAIVCMSIVLCKNDIFNTGVIEAYAEEKPVNGHIRLIIMA